MDQPAAHANHRVIALIVASALLMQNLDSAVVATALPSMARDMGEDLARLGAAITSYLVALTVFIPFSSRLLKSPH
jgi:MFS family permease